VNERIDVDGAAAGDLQAAEALETLSE